MSKNHVLDKYKGVGCEIEKEFHNKLRKSHKMCEKFVENKCRDSFSDIFCNINTTIKIYAF